MDEGLLSEARQKFAAGRIKAYRMMPYYQSLLTSVETFERPGLGTFAIDNQWRMYYDPEYCLSLSVDEIAGAWLHEIQHILRKHAERYKLIPPSRRDSELFSSASDASINADLKQQGVTLPNQYGDPAQVSGWKPGLTSEQIYAQAYYRKYGDRDIYGEDAKQPDKANDHEDSDEKENESQDSNTAQTPSKPTPPDSKDQEDSPATSQDSPSDSSQDDSDGANEENPSKDSKQKEQQQGDKADDAKEDNSSATQDGSGDEQESLDSPNDEPGEGEPGEGEPGEDGDSSNESGDQPSSTKAGASKGKPSPKGSASKEQGANPDDFDDPEDIRRAQEESQAEQNLTDLLNELPQDSTSAKVSKSMTDTWDTDSSPDRGENPGSDDPEESEREQEPSSSDQASDGADPSDSMGDRESASDSAPDDESHDHDCGSIVDGESRSYEEKSTEGAVDKASANTILQQTAQSILDYDKSHPGTIPGDTVMNARRIIEPETDWQDELKDITKREIAAQRGYGDYSYSRPSRRGSSPGIIMPSLRAPMPPSIAVVIDTSGSMGINEEIAAALGELEVLINSFGKVSHVPGIHVINCDVGATAVFVRKLSEFQLIGGGGTDMRVGMRLAAKIKPRVDIVIILTDGYTPWMNEPPEDNATATYIALILKSKKGRSGNAEEAVPEWMRVITAEF